MAIYFKSLKSMLYNINRKYAIIIFFTLLLIKTHLNLQKLEKESLNANSDPKIVFISGIPRSGANLLRVLLNEHDQIQCNDQTHIISLFMETIDKRLVNNTSNQVLHKNGITREVIDASATAFLGSILREISDQKPVICVKERQILSFGIYVSQILPSSKFIFIIRDARAVLVSLNCRAIATSIFLQRFSIDYEQNFHTWNTMIEDMYNQCILVGRERCLPVYYEQLVLKPKYILKKILKFLNIDWNDALLYRGVNFDHKIKQSHEVISTINNETLYDWLGKIPKYLLEFAYISKHPMLKNLGYDTISEKPDYNKLDDRFLDKIFEKDSKTMNGLKNQYSIYF